MNCYNDVQTSLGTTIRSGVTTFILTCEIIRGKIIGELG